MNRFANVAKLAVAGCMLATCVAGTARASFIIATSLTTVPSDSSYMPIDLTGQLGASAITTAAYSVDLSQVAANQGVVTGSAGGVYAAPITGSMMPHAGNYFSTGLGTIDIHYATPQYSIALLC